MSDEVRPPFKTVRIKARDWAMSQGQWRTDGEWKVTTGWVSGWLIADTDEAIVVAHQLFHEPGVDDHWESRWTVTIPKETIMEKQVEE